VPPSGEPTKVLLRDCQLTPPPSVRRLSQVGFQVANARTSVAGM
jgi:hypothetical protein